MNLQHRTLVLPALLAAAALVMTGCGAGDDAKDSKADLPEGPITQRMSDLEKQFNADAIVSMTNAVEESVAACMKEQGFDYTPQSMDSDEFTQINDMPEWGSEEFAKTYGYGVTTQDDIPGVIDTYDDESMLDDPAYAEALWGSDLFGEADEDAEGGTDEATEGSANADAWLPGGCMGEAYASSGVGDLFTSTVAMDMSDLEDQADNDAEVVAAFDEWATCMADENYEYKTPEEAQDSFYQRFYAENGDRVTGDELKKLKDEEIATAVADYKCGTKAKEVRAKVMVRLETEYYDSHKTEVDAYITQLEDYLTKGSR